MPTLRRARVLAALAELEVGIDFTFPRRRQRRRPFNWRWDG